MEIIYGINPLAEALKVEPCRIVSLAVANGRRREELHAVLELAEARGVPVLFKERREIDKLAGSGLHQGIVGFCPSFVYADLNRVLTCRHPSLPYHLVLLLDGITDPQNLGALIRTAHCHGVSGVIIPEHRSAAVTAAVIKASAGAALLTPVARITNLSRAIEDLKKQGFWIYGTDTRAGRNIHDMTCLGHVGLVMGSEGRGMRPLIRKKCDFLVSVPMLGKVDSLNVAVAAGIILNNIVHKWANVEGVE